MVGQFGRALGLAIATALQTAVMAKERGVDVDQIGRGEGELRLGDPALKKGIRSVAWFDFGMGMVALVVVMVVFRGAGKVGGKH